MTELTPDPQESSPPLDRWNEPDPRRRVLALGPTALTDFELIHLVLGHRLSRSFLDGLLQKIDGLDRLFWVDQRYLAGTLGMEPAAAKALLAVVELSRRLGSSERTLATPLDRPEEVAQYVVRHHALDRQGIVALYVDMENHSIFHKEMVSGPSSGEELELGAIFRPAIEQSAAGLFLVRIGRPGCEVEVGSEDLSLVERVSSTVKLLGIRFLDYLIMGTQGSWVSLNQQGHWK